MGDLVIRNLDEATAHKLSRRAAEHGRSLEDEVRYILSETAETRTVTASSKSASLYEEIREDVESIGGIELELLPRHSVREPPDFSGPEWETRASE